MKTVTLHNISLVLAGMVLAFGIMLIANIFWPPMRYMTAPIRCETSIHTIMHDGHRFLLYDGEHRTAITHHPMCPCMTTDTL